MPTVPAVWVAQPAGLGVLAQETGLLPVLSSEHVPGVTRTAEDLALGASVLLIGPEPPTDIRRGRAPAGPRPPCEVTSPISSLRPSSDLLVPGGVEKSGYSRFLWEGKDPITYLPGLPLSARACAAEGAPFRLAAAGPGGLQQALPRGRLRQHVRTPVSKPPAPRHRPSLALGESFGSLL